MECSSIYNVAYNVVIKWYILDAKMSWLFWTQKDKSRTQEVPVLKEGDLEVTPGWVAICVLGKFDIFYVVPWVCYLEC